MGQQILPRNRKGSKLSPRNRLFQKEAVHERSDSGDRRHVTLSRFTFSGKNNRTWMGVITSFRNRSDRPRLRERAAQIVELYDQIKMINRSDHLGLRIPRTMRVLTVDGAKPQVVQSHYPNELSLEELPKRGDSPFYRDVVRQMEVLSRIGFDADLPAFIPVRTPRGEVQAILYHFALVQPKRERAPMQDIHRREWQKKK